MFTIFKGCHFHIFVVYGVSLITSSTVHPGPTLTDMAVNYWYIRRHLEGTKAQFCSYNEKW